MKKFKNKLTGCIEIVSNTKLLEQYEKHKDRYEEVKDKTSKIKAE